MNLCCGLEKDDGKHNEQHHHHDIVPKINEPRKHLLVFLDELVHQK